MRTALKEWAIAVEAIARGEQIVLVRKGGIREEAKEFQVEHDEFVLYPTYEHQREELLQTQFRTELAETLAGWGGPETVTLTAWAAITDRFTVTEQEAVARLAPYYVYSEGYAEERLRWRPRKPLHILLIRAYRLSEAVTLPVMAAYLGCRSWVHLEQAVVTSRNLPVLDDAAFEQLRGSIRAVLRGCAEVA